MLAKMQKLSKPKSGSGFDSVLSGLTPTLQKRYPPRTYISGSAPSTGPPTRDLLLVIDLLLWRQPIRRQHDQRYRIDTSKYGSDVVHRLEELQLGDDIGVGAFDFSQGQCTSGMIC